MYKHLGCHRFLISPDSLSFLNQTQKIGGFREAQCPLLSLNVLKLEKILGKICPLGSFEFLDEEYMP